MDTLKHTHAKHGIIQDWNIKPVFKLFSNNIKMNSYKPIKSLCISKSGVEKTPESYSVSNPWLLLGVNSNITETGYILLFTGSHHDVFYGLQLDYNSFPTGK